MKPSVRTYLVDDAGERIFGPGPAELLRRVREHGSLRAASISMGMAYTKALALMRRAEKGLGVKLTMRTIGGTGGGGSVPTPEADALLEAYERWSGSVSATAGAQFASAFAEVERGRALRASSAQPQAAPSSAPRPGDAGANRPGAHPADTPASSAAPATSAPTQPTPAPHIGVAVLAAGRGERFGSNKLVEPLLGEPVLLRTLGAVPPGLPMVAAVSAPATRELLEARGIDVVQPAGPLQSDSLRALVAYAREAGWDACVFLPGDQPLVEQGSIRSMLAVANARPDACVRLSWRRRPAAPTLFSSKFYDALQQVQGDAGGHAALAPTDPVALVEAMWPWELWDVDTPSDLARVQQIIEAGLGRGGSF